MADVENDNIKFYMTVYGIAKVFNLGFGTDLFISKIFSVNTR